jgi:hypothetical protein
VVSVVSVKSVFAAPRGEALRQWRFYLPRPSATPSNGGYAPGRVFSGSLAGSQVGDTVAAALCREGAVGGIGGVSKVGVRCPTRRSLASAASVKSVSQFPALCDKLLCSVLRNETHIFVSPLVSLPFSNRSTRR